MPQVRVLSPRLSLKIFHKKFFQKILKKLLTNQKLCDIINKSSGTNIKNIQAGVAQLVEQLICNQQVGGSSPSTSSILPEFPENFSDFILWESSRVAKGGRL